MWTGSELDSAGSKGCLHHVHRQVDRLSAGCGTLEGLPAQALEASKSAKLGRTYFDWNDWLKNHPNTPYTPSIPLLYGLRESLRLLRSEGYENYVARHARHAPRTLRLPCVPPRPHAVCRCGLGRGKVSARSAQQLRKV